MTERSARADGGASPRQVPVCRTRSWQGLGWDRVCEAQRSNESPNGAFKRQCGLRQQMEGRCPNKSTSEIRRSLRSEVPDGPCSLRGQKPSTSIGGSFCFAGALRDGVVYSAQFNNSEFVEENMQGERKTLTQLSVPICLETLFYMLSGMVDTLMLSSVSD